MTSISIIPCQGEELKNEFAATSMKFGLLRPDQIIEPYDETLNNLNVLQKREWAKRVYQQLLNEMNIQPWKWEDVESIAFHAGKEYRRFLIDMLPETVSVNIPLKGLGIGEQLKFYAEEGY